MFREKYNSSSDKRGYLYLRETVYERDGRTYKRKPAKFGDGKATKNRGKYSKKKDTYLGKIEEIQLKKILTFDDYLKNEKNINNIFEYKLNLNFDSLLDLFIEYLLFIYELEKEEFEKPKKKKVYNINEGYFSPITMDWIRRFRINSNYTNPNEMYRFSNRCKDSGIFDEQVIESLYTKLSPIDEKLLAEEEKNKEIKKLKIKNYRDFIKQSIE